VPPTTRSVASKIRIGKNLDMSLRAMTSEALSGRDLTIWVECVLVVGHCNLRLVLFLVLFSAIFDWSSEFAHKRTQTLIDGEDFARESPNKIQSCRSASGVSVHRPHQQYPLAKFLGA
jgi:hypothetical protein